MENYFDLQKKMKKKDFPKARKSMNEDQRKEASAIIEQYYNGKTFAVCRNKLLKAMAESTILKSFVFREGMNEVPVWTQELLTFSENKVKNLNSDRLTGQKRGRPAAPRVPDFEDDDDDCFGNLSSSKRKLQSKRDERKEEEEDDKPSRIPVFNKRLHLEGKKQADSFGDLIIPDSDFDFHTLPVHPIAIKDRFADTFAAVAVKTANKLTLAPWQALKDVNLLKKSIRALDLQLAQGMQKNDALAAQKENLLIQKKGLIYKVCTYKKRAQKFEDKYTSTLDKYTSTLDKFDCAVKDFEREIRIKNEMDELSTIFLNKAIANKKNAIKERDDINQQLNILREQNFTLSNQNNQALLDSAILKQTLDNLQQQLNTERDSNQFLTQEVVLWSKKFDKQIDDFNNQCEITEQACSVSRLAIHANIVRCRDNFVWLPFCDKTWTQQHHDFMSLLRETPYQMMCVAFATIDAMYACASTADSSEQRELCHNNDQIGAAIEALYCFVRQIALNRIMEAAGYGTLNDESVQSISINEDHLRSLLSICQLYPSLGTSISETCPLSVNQMIHAITSVYDAFQGPVMPGVPFTLGSHIHGFLNQAIIQCTSEDRFDELMPSILVDGIFPYMYNEVIEEEKAAKEKKKKIECIKNTLEMRLARQDELQCAICYDMLDQDEHHAYANCSCKNLFHIKCLVKSYKVDYRCPHCRSVSVCKQDACDVCGERRVLRAQDDERQNQVRQRLLQQNIQPEEDTLDEPQTADFIVVSSGVNSAYSSEKEEENQVVSAEEDDNDEEIEENSDDDDDDDDDDDGSDSTYNPRASSRRRRVMSPSPIGRGGNIGAQIQRGRGRARGGSQRR